jgi:hypothetical protein
VLFVVDKEDGAPAAPVVEVFAQYRCCGCMRAVKEALGGSRKGQGEAQVVGFPAGLPRLRNSQEGNCSAG